MVRYVVSEVFKVIQTTNTNIQMCDKIDIPDKSENIIYMNDLK